MIDLMIPICKMYDKNLMASKSQLFNVLNHQKIIKKTHEFMLSRFCLA